MIIFSASVIGCHAPGKVNSKQPPQDPCQGKRKAPAVILTVTRVKDGYTYARSAYRLYRARLDTVLKPGDRITADPCRTPKKYFFTRVK